MENKSITKLARLFLIIWNISLFLIVWLDYYNEYAFDAYHMFGGFISILIYGIIYISLCNLYKAYRFASSEIGETIFSQVLSFGIADLILYVECCLIHNHYINILPGLVTVILQIVGTTVLVTFTKQYMINHIPSKTTILIYGKEISELEAEQFKERLLNKYKHLFAIEYMEKEVESIEDFINRKQDYAYWQFVLPAFHRLWSNDADRPLYKHDRQNRDLLDRSEKNHRSISGYEY